MPVWMQLLIYVLLTAITVAGVLCGFWYWIVRPWLAERVRDVIAASNEIEPRVVTGVQKGVSESIRQLPQSAWDGATGESTRQFLRFGSSLFENGLSTFLRAAAEPGQAPKAGDSESHQE